MIHITPLLLTVRDRNNFENLSCYGSFKEATYRVRYEGSFTFEQLNKELILSIPAEERIIAFDRVAKREHLLNGFFSEFGMNTETHKN